MMPEYRAIYKCRLCGEEICSDHTESQEEVIGFALSLSVCNLKDTFKIHKCACEQIMHVCKDGSFGLADFRGFRKVE